MNVSRARKGVVLCSLALIGLVALLDMRRAAPGPLTRVHANVPELAGDNSCASCHGGWFSDMSSACLECHEMVADHIRASEGLHGTFDRSEAVRCASCHSEHHGADFVMVNAGSFARADVPKRDDFDHVRVGFLMDGAHLELGCSECHEQADSPGLLEGEHRFLGLDQDCLSCHEDNHDGQMSLSCTSCHGQQSFDALDSRGHDRFLPLHGAHGELDCRACHAADSDFALEAIGPSGGALAPRECVSCHESPHMAPLVESAAQLAQQSPGMACRVCHQDDQPDFLAARGSLNPVHHELAGFSFDAPHAGLACADCHDPALPFAERHPGRLADDCAACHEDPHGGQFAGSPLATNGCVSCHAREHFAPPAFGVEQHAQAALALDGQHAEAECSACHEQADEQTPRRFRGTPTRCESCHADAHADAFAQHVVELDAEPAGSCAVCHGTGSFAELPHDFDHEHFTGFPVTGSHAQTACGSCHEAAAEPDDAGRTFGHAPATAAEALACAACHDDPHGGAFDGEFLPRVVNGAEGCARCHDSNSFRNVAARFEHHTWTGFALGGAHASLDCSACHAVQPGADRNLAPALGDTCADCHADPHVGQFRVDGAVDCARCHRDAGPFGETLRFDHERDARFMLGEAHGELACSACHESVDVSGTSVVRYRPLSTACVDCHGVPEDVLLRQPGARR